MYIIAARRMTSGDLLKYRTGLFITADDESSLSSSSQFSLTMPSELVAGPRLVGGMRTVPSRVHGRAVRRHARSSSAETPDPKSQCASKLIAAYLAALDTSRNSCHRPRVAVLAELYGNAHFFLKPVFSRSRRSKIPGASKT